MLLTGAGLLGISLALLFFLGQFTFYWNDRNSLYCSTHICAFDENICSYVGLQSLKLMYEYVLTPWTCTEIGTDGRVDERFVPALPLW